MLPFIISALLVNSVQNTHLFKMNHITRVLNGTVPKIDDEDLRARAGISCTTCPIPERSIACNMTDCKPHPPKQYEKTIQKCRTKNEPQKTTNKLETQCLKIVIGSENNEIYQFSLKKGYVQATVAKGNENHLDRIVLVYKIVLLLLSCSKPSPATDHRVPLNELR